MKKKIDSAREPIDTREITDTSLPSPEKLSYMDEKVKVTLYLSKYTVDYFKSEANKNNTKYQRMIRILLDQYTTFHDN